MPFPNNNEGFAIFPNTGGVKTATLAEMDARYSGGAGNFELLDYETPGAATDEITLTINPSFINGNYQSLYIDYTIDVTTEVVADISVRPNGETVSAAGSQISTFGAVSTPAAITEMFIARWPNASVNEIHGVCTLSLVNLFIVGKNTCALYDNAASAFGIYQSAFTFNPATNDINSLLIFASSSGSNIMATTTNIAVYGLTRS